MSRIRVRIAPSPTGSPHVGTAYIALFNYCFAKSQGGDFLLRIEDTDQTRSRKEYEDHILNALKWTGLTWDEGPDVGGDYGPYRQSERTAIYREHAEILLRKGAAFKCFCTPERLDSLRAEQKAVGGQLGYDGHCLSLSDSEIAELEASGAPHTVRLNVPREGACNIEDPLRGTVTFEYATIDYQILLKSDGFPTYHLANVVDDHLMEISHVIRGEEWLPSLPKHILLYEAFEWDAPQVIHLPLLRNEDKSKLSKRKNPTSILFYKENGILSEALINFLGLMAYSLPDGQEIFALEEMVKSFNIKRVHLGGPIFDRDKLKWVNQQHIARLPESEVYDRLAAWRFNPEFMRKLIPLMMDRMHKLGDFMKHCDFMFYSDLEFPAELLVPKKRTLEEVSPFLQIFAWELEGLEEWSAEGIEQTVKTASEKQEWPIRDAAHILRVAICGKTVAPPLFQVMDILGRDIIRNRVMSAITIAGPLGKKKLSKLEKAWRAMS